MLAKCSESVNSESMYRWHFSFWYGFSSHSVSIDLIEFLIELRRSLMFSPVRSGTPVWVPVRVIGEVS